MATIVFEEGPKAPRPSGLRKQLLCHVVDGMAASRPNASYAEYPTDPNCYSKGYSRITYAAFANAINGLAWWLKDHIGHAEEFETLTYMGPNDFRHNALILAACKAGYKMLLCSPRNTMAGYKNLFDTLECKNLLAAQPHPQIVDTLLEAHPLRLLRVPSITELLSQKYPHYPYDKYFSKAQDEPLVVLHTSGTTSLPKPIILTHNWVATWIAMCQLEPPAGTESLDRLHQGNRMFVMMPPAHAGNIMPTLFDAVFNQTTIIYPLPDVTLSPAHIVDCLSHTKADIALIPPWMVHEVGQNQELLDFVGENLESIFYTGGDVAEPFGDAVSSRVKLFNVNGATEMASFPALRPTGNWSSNVWKYIMPHPVAGIDFRCHSWDGGDAKYEAVIVRNADPEFVQPIFTVYPHLDEYHSGDLFSPHPTIPGLWEYRGRGDDCFVLVTGSNICPLMMEQKVIVHPEVKGVLMIGQRRPAPALLVETCSTKELSPEAQAEMVDMIWPLIEEGNLSYYEAARVTKDRVLLTYPDKPMKRAGKGTVQRRATVDMYMKEIEELYTTKKHY
ncbi:acetyl-CoA synthetase-like protein [Lindgomyces ingoldianus]|uniref:Acetyl-CoA synthetase-like protein n=1 Tax=Lindgomyces ingoldianus TaxID=673940 RepID=A0ACB6QQU6_9PLEO|nr:acetyl-CoA synthetase-like protein [Lindgomyces ingoldianus]KAF2468470.1 acetyl-CoA synthetase-like protein [Lindgomyces ingoldianus]